MCGRHIFERGPHEEGRWGNASLVAVCPPVVKRHDSGGKASVRVAQKPRPRAAGSNLMQFTLAHQGHKKLLHCNTASRSYGVCGSKSGAARRLQPQMWGAGVDYGRAD